MLDVGKRECWRGVRGGVSGSVGGYEYGDKSQQEPPSRVNLGLTGGRRNNRKHDWEGCVVVGHRNGLCCSRVSEQE